MEKTTKISPFRLASLLRLQNDPTLALNLFLNPSPNSTKPFKYSLLSYDLIITKLGRAKMFDKMEQILQMLKNETRFVPKEVIFCNVIKFYARGRLPDRALEVFERIPSFGCQRTVKSVNTLLNALLSCREFEKVRELFVGIGKYADPDVCSYNILINACFSGGDVEGALKVFDEMRKRGFRPNVVTFGSLINGLCVNLKLDEALRLKDSMVRDFNLKPNDFVYAALIKGLCKAGNFSSALELKDDILKNSLELGSGVFASLINELFKAGRRGDAITVVDELMENGFKLDTVAYNAMISGFCFEKDFNAAFRAMDEMGERECKPDVVTFNIIISGLCKEGLLEKANDLFNNMSKRECVPDIVTYRIIFDGLCDGMQLERAALLLDEMVVKGYTPRSESLTKYIGLLGKSGNWKLMRTVSSSLRKGNLIDAASWERFVNLVCSHNELLKEKELVDTLVWS